MNFRTTLHNFLGHLHTVHIHRKWVRRYCRWAGIWWRGIKHDLSKYSPTEFWESVKYYQGTSSPIDAAKAANGWSKAWQHHKGRNTHHYEYWWDDFDHGGHPLIMPEDDFVEMVCDYLGAGQAYSGAIFSYSREYKWWLDHRDEKGMHPCHKVMLDIIFSDLEKAENPMLIHANTEMMRDFIPEPEQLIKSGYIREVYRANLPRSGEE